MKGQVEDIINNLLKHEITKEKAVNELLFLYSVSSSICVGDYVRIDYTGYGKVIKKIDEEKVLVKYDSGVEYPLAKWRLKKYM